MELGNLCKDVVTGFEGILVSRATYVTGCDRVWLQPQDAEKESKGFDISTVRVINEGVYQEIKDTINSFNDIENAIYEFGIKVKDKITDYIGIIVVKHIAMSGDISYALSPKYSEISRDNDAKFFDEGRLEIVSEDKVEIETNKKELVELFQHLDVDKEVIKMSTNAKVSFYENGEHLVSIYHHHDGCLSGVGLDLANFLNNIKLGHMCRESQLYKVANGFDDLAAQYIRKFKDSVGNVYITFEDTAQYYNYQVHCYDGEITMIYGEFEGSPQEFINMIKGDEE